MVHREILLKKPFLKYLYKDWYNEFRSFTPEVEGTTLELGSGGGFLKDVIPDVVTSDILPLDHVDLVFSAESLPYQANALKAIYLLNTLHHIPDPISFLREVDRCLVDGGRMICIEPAHTLLSSFIYTHIHHEPFKPEAGYFLQPGNPLSNSNQALPWILFRRDWSKLRQDFPGLHLLRCYNHTPFRFLLSGGFSFRAFLPGFSYPLIRALEKVLPRPLHDVSGMFMTVVLEKA